MTIVTTTVKGQIVIPAHLRKKYGIKKGTPVNIYEQGGKIIVEPIPDDPIETGKGMLKTKGRILARLLADRREESKI